jgi:hypothetical protein
LAAVPDKKETGPTLGPTSADAASSWPPPSGGIGTVFSTMRAEADFGALSALGSVRAIGAGARGSIGGVFGGSSPTAAAVVDDTVLIGGSGIRDFQLHFSLNGSAGKTGPGQFSFAASQSLQVWGGMNPPGTTLQVIGGPAPTGFSFSPPFVDTYSLSASGTAPQAFGTSDFLVVRATGPGSVNMNLSFALSGYMSIDNGVETAESLGTLQLGGSSPIYIVPITSGTSFASGSGHDYLLSAVPEASTMMLMLGALPLVGWAACRRGKQHESR